MVASLGNLLGRGLGRGLGRTRLGRNSLESKKLSCSLLVLLASTHCTGALSIPGPGQLTGVTGWTISSLDSDRGFHYTPVPMSWAEAEDYCQTEYGHLATDDSGGELRQFLAAGHIGGAVWIGLHQSRPQTQFTWTNDFDWSEESLEPGAGWAEYVEEYEAALCVSLDIDRGFRWDTRYCQGVLVAGTVCQVTVPPWVREGKCEGPPATGDHILRYFPEKEVVNVVEGGQTSQLCSIEDKLSAVSSGTRTSAPSSTNDTNPDPISTSEHDPSSTGEPAPSSSSEPAPSSTGEPAPSSTGEPAPSSTSELSPSSTGEPAPSSSGDITLTSSSNGDTTSGLSSTSEPAPSSTGDTTPIPISNSYKIYTSSSNSDTTSTPSHSSSQTSVPSTKNSNKTETGPSSTITENQISSSNLKTVTSQARAEVTSEGTELSDENSTVSQTRLTEQNSTISSQSMIKKEFIALEAITSGKSIQMKSTQEYIGSSQTNTSSSQETSSFSNKTSTPIQKTSSQMQKTAILSQEAVSPSRQMQIPSQQLSTTSTESSLTTPQSTLSIALGNPDSLFSSGPVTTDFLIPGSPLMDLDSFTADTESVWTTEMVSQEKENMDTAELKNMAESVTHQEVIMFKSTSEKSLKDITATTNQPLILLKNSTYQITTAKDTNPKPLSTVVLTANKNINAMIPFDETNHKPVVAQIDEKHIIQMTDIEIPPMFEGEDPIDRTEINQVIRAMLGDSDDDATANQQRQKREALHERGLHLPRKWRRLENHQRAARTEEVARTSGPQLPGI